MLVSWIVEPGGDWSAPLRSWVEGNGCDAWLLHHGTDDPLTHTGKWLRHEAGSDQEAYADTVDRWLAYFERLGIEQIAVGAVVLRRRSGLELVPGGRAPERAAPAGERPHPARLRRPGLPRRPRRRGRAARGSGWCSWSTPASSSTRVYRGREWGVAEIALSLEEGLGFRGSLDPTVAALLAALDGQRTLGEIAADLARIEGATSAAVEQALLPAAREMLAAGFLGRR